jgi:hypothetical protein
LAGQIQTVKRMAREFDAFSAHRAQKTLDSSVTRGSVLTFFLSLSAGKVDGPMQELVWRGQPEAVQFGITLPSTAKTQDIIGTVYVTQGSVPFGHVKFVVSVVKKTAQLSEDDGVSLADTSWRRYKYAFISYASPDRAEVLKRVQMLPRLSVRFFQDLLKLEPGDRWAKKLYTHIDKSDVFFLFWSSAAKRSEWVMKEVKYAITRQAGDEFAPPEIVPIIIEGPPPVPPPRALRHLHFNDPFVYFIAAPS